MTQPTPIIFTVTDVGKNAALNAIDAGLQLKLKILAYGSGKYVADKSRTNLLSKVGSSNIISGDIETQSHTLRFSSTLYANQITPVYELGLFADDDTLFAVASSTTEPLLTLYPDIAFVGSFGLLLDELDTSNITIVNDPNGALSIVLMEQHLAQANPHPQYAKKNDLNKHTIDPKAHGIDTLIKRIVALENRKIEPVKVGGLLLTTNDYKNSDEVRAGEGYGIWQRYGDGEALVALAQETNSAADFMKSIGGKGGEYTHQLTIDEMPKHVHRLAGSKWSPKEGSYPLSDEQVVLASKTIDANMRLASIHDDVLTDNYTVEPRDWASAGGNQAHNIIQKSIVIGVWVRTA